MQITYIHHSCFSVETEEVILLFDYFKGNIPDFDHKKHLFVFASHKHQDHFDASIFELAKTYPHITFVLSNDIRMDEAYMDKIKIPETVRNHILMVGKHESIELPVHKRGDGRDTASGKLLSLQLETLASTDEGIAFVISLEDKVIYHAGDLNWWSWNGETQDEYMDMTNRFQKEMTRLKDREFDVAFVPLDPRQEDRFWWGLDYFMKTAKAKLVFPMHFWKDYSVIAKLKSMEKAKEYFDQIVDIKEEGQIFNL